MPRMEGCAGEGFWRRKGSVGASVRVVRTRQHGVASVPRLHSDPAADVRFGCARPVLPVAGMHTHKHVMRLHIELVALHPVSVL